jgi:hypothetical protein
MSPRRNLKTRRWHKKSGRTEQSVISSRNGTPLAKLSSKPFMHQEQQVEKLTEANMPMLVEEKQTLSRKSAIIPHATRD